MVDPLVPRLVAMQRVAALTAARMQKDRMGVASLTEDIEGPQQMILGQYEIIVQLALDLAHARGTTPAEVLQNLAARSLGMRLDRAGHPSNGSEDVVD